MSIRVFEDFGAAEKNKAIKAGTIESIGPVTVILHNQGTVECVLRAEKLSDGSAFLTDKDTVRAAEDTGYDGDTTDLVFTGQALNNLPVVPGTVVVTPTAGGDTVNLVDKDADGLLYTDDVDSDFAGTIDYFTGALELSFPAGKAPNTTNILCDYTSQDATLKNRGRKNYEITNVLDGESVVVKIAAKDVAGSHVRMSAAATWV